MGNRKTTDLVELGALSGNHLLKMVDVEEVNSSQKDKKVTISTLANYLAGVGSSSGFSVRVSVVHTSNFAAAYSSGVLTATATGGLTVDGIVLQAGSNLLLAGQTDATQNGIYIVTTLGVGGVSYTVLTRRSDMSLSVDLDSFIAVNVVNGSTYAGTWWGLDVERGGIVLDTDDLDFIIVDKPFISGSVRGVETSFPAELDFANNCDYKITQSGALVIPDFASGAHTGLPATIRIFIDGDGVNSITAPFEINGNSLDETKTNYILLISDGDKLVESYNKSSYHGFLPQNSVDIAAYWDGMRGADTIASVYSWTDRVNDYVLGSSGLANMTRIAGGWAGDATDNAFSYSDTELINTIVSGLNSHDLQIHVAVRKLAANTGAVTNFVTIGSDDAGQALVRLQNNASDSVFMRIADDSNVGVISSGTYTHLDDVYIMSVVARDDSGDLMVDLYVNGVLEETLDCTSLGTFNEIDIIEVMYQHINGGVYHYYNGSIYDLVIIDSSTTDLTNTINYLKGKHGIT